LIDCPEMNYTINDKPYPRGEILVKTPTMIGGYFKNEKATNEQFVDGWFRTGDIGEQRAGSKIVVIDRKKNIFKLAQGEFVA
jgi:long-chain acyl-CoA synthetase